MIVESNKVQVTILVLVEYSLQLDERLRFALEGTCHNPCFSRILFAIG